MRKVERVILHSDLNSFYASVECLYRPELRDKPVAVAGSIEDRHGIILTKNQIAKKFEIKTGEAIWQAKMKCPQLVVVPPNYPLYLKFSKMAQAIYSDYSDKIEPFGIDESWCDVSGSCNHFNDGIAIAEEIRQRIKSEMGVTVSIGVSYNKIFAKLGSDMKKPDAVTVISKENFKEKVWPLASNELLYVGRATYNKLEGRCIHTIGDIANADLDMLKRLLGKWGEYLWMFANGLDTSAVAQAGDVSPVKSIGNSTTAYRDLENDTDVKIVLNALAESVAMRMREQGFKCKTVCINVRDKNLQHFDRQCKIEKPTNSANDIAFSAFDLFQNNYDWKVPIRSIGVKGTDFVGENTAVQLDLFTDDNRRIKREKINKAVDNLRNRFGFSCIKRAVVMQDLKFSELNARDDHTIHPYNYF
ncbi:MAG: DNA polymerase IV [Sedimentibacter sp.]